MWDPMCSPVASDVQLFMLTIIPCVVTANCRGFFDSEWVHPWHICIETGLAPPTSAPGLGARIGTVTTVSLLDLLLE